MEFINNLANELLDALNKYEMRYQMVRDIINVLTNQIDVNNIPTKHHVIREEDQMIRNNIKVTYKNINDCENLITGLIQILYNYKIYGLSVIKPLNDILHILNTNTDAINELRKGEPGIQTDINS